MTSVIAVRGMLRTDAVRLRRDRFVLLISVYIIAVTVLIGRVLPEISAGLARDSDFDLTPYHSLIVSHLIVQTVPLVPGIVGGFMLLESREDGTVKALLVSPNSLTSYVAVMSVVMSVAALALTLAEGALIAFALPSWPALVAVGLVAAPGGPILALLIAAIANNKLQAFVYMKLFGLGPMLVVGAFFAPAPWQWLAAIYPPYCASKAYWVAEAGGSEWPLWVLVGLISSVAWLGVLRRLYLNAARK